MSKLEGILGIGTFGLAFASGITSGIAAAKGVHILPESVYLLSFLGVAGFCYGARTHPEVKADVPVGFIYGGAVAAVAGFSFGAAYLAEKLI